MHLFNSRTNLLFEVTLFSETLLQCRDLLKSEGALLVTADARRENETVKLLGVRLQPLEDVIVKNTQGWDFGLTTLIVWRHQGNSAQ